MLLLGGGVGGGVLVYMVALPLAFSSPFPTLNGGSDWVIDNPPATTALLAEASPQEGSEPQTDARMVMASLNDSDDRPLTFAERWKLRVPQAALADAPDQPTVIFPDPAPRAPEAAPGHRRRPASAAKAAGPETEHGAPHEDPVVQYLWEVYLRKPVKSDSTGDFTWKDKAAAKRLGMSLRDYVIGGMDPDFREELYDAGRAMDASGLHWSILSAFRDDYRQSLAAGFKARVGNSLHGGSRATGGYGHGRAVDVTSADGDSDAIWHWVDVHGARYGLIRPMPRIDPAHIQARGAYHAVARDLRAARLRREARLNGSASGRTRVAARLEK